MILFSMFAFLLYASAVAPLALLVLGLFKPTVPARRSHVSAPRTTTPGLTAAACRDLELRVSRRLYPGPRLSTHDVAA